MLAIVSSDVVVIGVVVGIPAVVAFVIILWARAAAPVQEWIAGLSTLLAVVLVAIAVWAVFRPSGHEAAAALRPPGPPLTESPSSAPPTQPAPGASCAPSGTTVRETAQGIAFSQSCLAAPANKGFTIQFDNKDTGVPHNIHIFESDPAGNPSAASLFSGSLVTGPATTSYAVGALPAGTYYFHCDVHPIQMHGTFVVA